VSSAKSRAPVLSPALNEVPVAGLDYPGLFVRKAGNEAFRAHAAAQAAPVGIRVPWPKIANHLSDCARTQDR
jgi:hypothetical protein